jgi:hypothetical protein
VGKILKPIIAAFDKYFSGIPPDYVIEVCKDLLDEEDGPIPTCRDGLKD